MRKKQTMSDEESDRIFLLTHSRGVTTEQLMEAMIATARQMAPDEKAIFRARLNRSLGLIKSSQSKPS
jgi:hypothetical protein